MKTPPPVALLCAGNLTDSSITRFRGLAARLGPVKSSSLRLASRFANILRAGHPVDDYEAFRECRLILVAVPDALALGTLENLAAAALDWKRVSIVICSAALESDKLKTLSGFGAHTASLCEATGFDGRLFLAEGDPAAIKLVRPLIEGRESKVLALPADHKKFYLAALACSGPLLTPLLFCAAECLKLAGIGPADAAGLLQNQIERTTRAFLKGSRKGTPSPVDLEQQIAALRSRDPELGEFLKQSVNLTATARPST